MSRDVDGTDVAGTLKVAVRSKSPVAASSEGASR